MLVSGLAQTARDEKSDFWIIEAPSALVIYNQYEQRLSAEEKAALGSFSAWRILDFNHLLSDFYTHTIKTEQSGLIYFFQISDTGELVNHAQAGKIQKIANATVLGDTVQILKNKNLILNSGNSDFALSEGSLLQRLFTHRGKTFARYLNGQVYGWVSGNQVAGWKIYHGSEKNKAVENRIFEQVDIIFNSYNSRLKKLFVYFNNKNQSQYDYPQWVGQKNPSLLIYRFQPVQYSGKFDKSRSFLIQELHDLLYGSEYVIAENLEEIIICKSNR
jgi:hypothetical protein